MHTRTGSVGTPAASGDLARALLSVVGGLLVVLDREGHVVEVNEEACRLIGLPRAQILGVPWIPRFVPASVQPAVELVRAKLQAGAVATVEHFENPILTASGDERTILWHNAVLHDPEGAVSHVVASGVDITDRVRLECEQREALARAAASEQRYRTTFETAATPIARLDRRGTILDCNRAAEQVFGYPAEALRGRPVTVLIHPDDHPRLAVDLRDILELGTYHHRTYRAVRSDAAEILIEVDAAAVPPERSGANEIVCQVADVTAQARDLRMERLSARLLRVAHRHDTLPGLCQAFCSEIQEATGLPAVAVRHVLPDGSIESVANLGFPATFHHAGDAPGADPGCCYAAVLSGRAGPALGPCTPGGSFVLRDPSPLGDADAEPESSACQQACSQAGFRSLATIPVRSGEVVLGVVQVAASSPDDLPDDMVLVLEGATLQLGQAMRRILAEQSLHRQLAFQQELLDAIPIPVCHHDLQGRVVGANRSWRRTVGEVEEAGGGRAPRPLSAESMQNSAATSAPSLKRPASQGRSLQLHDTAGQLRRVELHRAQFREPEQGDGGTIVALVDVTDLTQATAALQSLNEALEGKVQERVAEIQSLFRLSHDLVHARSLDDIARAALHHVLALPPELCLLALHDGTRMQLFGRARRVLAPGVSRELHRTLAAGLQRLGLPQLSSPLEVPADVVPGARPTPPIPRLESSYMLPLQVEGRSRSLGVLLVAAERAGAFNEDQARAFHLAAAQIAEATHRRRTSGVEAEPPPQPETTAQLPTACPDLRAILDLLPDAVMVLDPSQHVILANRSALELLGLPAGGPPPGGVPLRALPLDTRRLETALLPGDLHTGGWCQVDLRFQDPLGRPGVLQAHLLPIEGSSIRGATLLVAQDATQRRALEHRLVQARKMESIGQLAAGIAHEINTPTQYVGDNLQFLKDSFQELQGTLAALRDASFPAGDALPAGSPHAIARDTRERLDLDFLLEEIPLSLEQAQEGVARIAGIVGAMREFSHGQGAEKVVTDVNRCIQSTATVARNEWKYVADLVLDLDPELPMIPTMAAELNQVLLNLLTNAAQAIGETVQDDGRGTITVRTERWERGARVTVTDNGCGIPFELQPRVFEPFFTTKPVGRGTGQGLAISRAVVTEKLGGELDFESTPGVGTTFRLTLPGEA
ncbi:MAG: PAS domain S-box protein [Pseudomonadota bacterium]